MNKFLDKTLLLLVCLIPPSLITGPFLPDLFLTLVSIFFLLICFIRKDLKYFNNLYFYLFIFFYIYICLTSLFSSNPLYSFINSFLYIRFIIFPIGLFYLIMNHKNVLLFVFISAGLSLILALLSGYFQYFFGFNFGDYNYHGKRLTGIFGKEQKLGSYLVRVFPLFLALLFLIIKKKKIQLPIFVISFILISLLVFLSGERAAFFYVILTVLVTVFCVNRMLLVKLSVIGSLIIFISVVIANDLKVRERMIDDTIKHLNLSSLNIDKLNLFSIAHEKIIFTSLKIYKDNYILGSGFKSFRLECKKKEYYDEVGCRNHPHNTYVQLLTETGILGFIFFISIFLYICFLLFRQFIIVNFRNRSFTSKHQLSNYQIFLILSFFITLWPFIPTGNFFNNWLSVIYYFPVGFYLSQNKLNEHI